MDINTVICVAFIHIVQKPIKHYDMKAYGGVDV
jgi:hypothetical protein